MHSKIYKLWEENRNKNFGLLNNLLELLFDYYLNIAYC